MVHWRFIIRLRLDPTLVTSAHKSILVENTGITLLNFLIIRDHRVTQGLDQMCVMRVICSVEEATEGGGKPAFICAMNLRHENET